jgi:single-strand DNA-binding protein
VNTNSVVLSGRLGDAPELRMTQAGLAVGRFSLAVQGFRNQEKTTDWIDVTVFGKTAEHAGQYLRKGARVVVTGRLQQDKWEDKETGAKRSKVGVVANTIEIIDWPEKDGEQTEDTGDIW